MMNDKMKLLLCFACCLVSNGVMAKPEPPGFLLTLKPDQVFQVESELLSEDHWQTVLSYLESTRLSKNTVDHWVSALKYMKAYSYFGADLPDEAMARILGVLDQVRKKTRLFKRHPELQWAYTTNYHRWFTLYPAGDWRAHLQFLIKQLPWQVKHHQGGWGKHALWENLYAQIGVLRWAQKVAGAEQKKWYVDHLSAHLQGLEKAGEISRPDWVTQHLLWLVGKIRLLEDDEAGEVAAEKWAVSLIEGQHDLAEEERRRWMTEYFLVPIFATQQTCENSQWTSWCYTADIDDVLPINHACNDELFIRAEQLTDDELQRSCAKLTSQEAGFHALLDTQKQPVPNDFNESLRVVIFDDWYQYHRYAPMLFNINTDNGGIYIEGQPSKPGNQATFFSFEAFWLRPEFKVWNLNHEYVHYLSGRYTTYGPFGHFPDHMVWWSEGLAEYIAKHNDNSQAIKLLLKTEADAFPTLEEVFSTAYADGLDLTYRWSYLTYRFLAEQHPEALLALKGFLRTDYFQGYLDHLKTLSQDHQSEYSDWLVELKVQSESQDEKRTRLPRKMNRYLYPKFLTPDWLDNEGWFQRH